MRSSWPALPLDDWAETCQTLHLWSQIVGKIRLARMPWINHSWHVPLYLTARGFTTSPIAHGDRTFEIDFDFRAHQLRIQPADEEARWIALGPMSVAEFYGRVMDGLADLGLPVEIDTMPVEIPDPVTRFPDDEAHAAYDTEAVERFWAALLSMHHVFTEFRSRFIGKVSPVHFFWGAFDLAVTRFSGRTAPKHPGGAPHVADWIMQEAYSHEVSSAGFWPGAGLGEPAFYSYAYPEPDGYREYAVAPAEAYYHGELGEWVLPYEAVRSADHPGGALLAFLDTTYVAAADLAEWDRDALEWSDGPPDGEP